MKRLNFEWLMGKAETGDEAPNPTRRAFLTGAVALAAAGTAVALGTTRAQAWHHGHPHGPPGGGHGGHNTWRSREWREQRYYDEHGPKRSARARRRYYHREYGSWAGRPQCMHLGPFGFCEY